MGEKRFFYSKRRMAGQPSGSSAETPEVSIKEKLFAILRSDPLVNSIVALAIAVGFVHGWLKVKVPGAATTFLFDGILCVALALVFFQQKRNDFIIPPGPVGRALKGFYLLCGIYLFLPMPESPPVLISIAAVRGWCFATLMFTLGYKVTRSVTQVKGYFYVVIAMGLLTSVYGIRQSPEAVEKQMQEDAVFAERYQNTYYHSSKGRQLRRFSTFVSSGAFGSTMAYVAVFALVLLTDPRCPRGERLFLAATLLPVAYGVVLSGARSALISLAFGFVIIAWHRRNFVNFIIVPLCLLLVIKFGAEITGGTITERYSTLLNFDEIWYRQTIPTSIGWDYMTTHWLGGGLGKSGHSVPTFFSSVLNYNQYVSSDGDLGRLMIDLGILGLLFFGQIMWTSMRTVYLKLREFQDTPVSAVALASAACIGMAFVTLPSGSPFLGVPMGALVWFFMGTFIKLVDEYKKGGIEDARAIDAAGGPKPAKRFGFHRPSGGSTSSHRQRGHDA